MFVYKPSDVIFSFGAGIYGMACLAIIVALLLRDPVWMDALFIETQNKPTPAE